MFIQGRYYTCLKVKKRTGNGPSYAACKRSSREDLNKLTGIIS